MNLKPKHLLLAIVATALISCIITASLVLSTTTTSTFYISGGIYPGAPAYTVWSETDGNYYAKDANGNITIYGTNASQIIQYVWDKMTHAGGSGGKLFLKSIGNDLGYTLDVPLNLHIPAGGWYGELEGESKFGTLINGTAVTSYAISISGAVGRMVLRNLWIQGGVWVETSSVSFENVNFDGSGTNRWNLLFHNTHVGRVHNCYVTNGDLGGILIEADGTVADVSDFVISNSLIWDNANFNILLDGHAVLTENYMVRDVTISNNYIEADISSPSFGVVLLDTMNIRIIGNTIAGEGNVSKDLLLISSDNTEASLYTIIVGNSIFATSNTWQYLVNFGRAANCTMSSNVLGQRNYTYGTKDLYISAYANNTIVLGNVISHGYTDNGVGTIFQHNNP